MWAQDFTSQMQWQITASIFVPQRRCVFLGQVLDQLLRAQFTFTSRVQRQSTIERIIANANMFKAMQGAMMQSLHMDDDVMITDIIYDYFEQKGYSVSTAENGARGLELFSKDRPDVASGYRLCQASKAAAILRRRTTTAEIFIDDLDVARRPIERPSALCQCVLPGRRLGVVVDLLGR